MLSAERLRELLDYNPLTGVWTWRVPPNKYSHHIRADDAIAGHRAAKGYRAITIDCRPYYVHRLAWLWMTGSWPTHDVDHRNGDRGDNRLPCVRRHGLRIFGMPLRTSTASPA